MLLEMNNHNLLTMVLLDRFMQLAAAAFVQTVKEGLFRALRTKAPCTDLIDGPFIRCCAGVCAYNIHSIAHIFQLSDSSQWRKSIFSALNNVDQKSNKQ